MKKKKETKKFLAIIVPLVIVLSLILGIRFYKERFYGKKGSETSIIDGLENEELVREKNLEGELSDNFPSQFPIYKDAVIDESWETQSDDVYAISVVWKVEEQPVKVFNFYEEGLFLTGYEVSVLSEESESYTIAFSKGKESGFIGITGTGQETLISVTIGNSN
jgi:hypothetical protein